MRAHLSLNVGDVWFKDPDGNSWEVFFVHHQLAIEAAEPPAGRACSPASGCC